MLKILLLTLGLSLGLTCGAAGEAGAQNGGQSIFLPQPTTTGGLPLMEAMKARRSDRSFKMEPLSDQQLADVLWSAVGVSRPDEGNLRTTPTAMNKQDVSVYALTEKGAFYYEAIEHRLDLIAPGDQTALAGAPLGLVFVAPADNKFSEVNVGYCSQNVYLYAASEGLNTVAKGTADRPALKKLLNLTDKQLIVLLQPVGPRP